MTQQPVYPPQPYAGQPPAQQPYAGQPYQQTQPQYPQAPQQGYPPQYPGQPQQLPPAPPLAQGTLDDYYNQPTAGGGPSVVWSLNSGTIQKPLGTTYVGIVARDVVHGDVQQDSDPKTQQPKVYRDGRPRWVMKIPLKSILTGPTPQQVGPDAQAYPEGEASWYVRGQARDELTRAVTAAGLTGTTSPKEGDVIQVTLVERRPSRGGGNPANVVQVTFQPGPRHVPGQAAPAAPEAVAPSPVPAPVAAPVPQGDPATAYAQQQVQAYTQPQQQGPPPTWAQPAAQAANPVVQQLQQSQLTPPAGLDEGQQALLARLQAAQQQG